MRKIAAILALCVAGIIDVSGQDGGFKQDVKVDFFEFFVKGNFGVQYERFLPNDQSVGVSANYFSNYQWGGHTSGQSVFAEYRWYFNAANDYTGYFVAPYAKYRKRNDDSGFGYPVDGNGDPVVDGDYYNYSDMVDGGRIASGVAFGISGGYKFVLPNRFVFEANLGFGRYIFDNWEFDTQYARDYFKRTIDWVDMADLKANVSIGYRF